MAEADPACSRETFELVVQLNGKVSTGSRRRRRADDELERLARESEKLAARLDGKAIVKTIVVPGKLVNFVAR